MLRLNEEIHNAKTEPDRVSLRWKIESTDREIDRLVYEIYGLTKVEVAVVEARSDPQSAALVKWPKVRRRPSN